ncbi:MAG: PAS domain-containing sensor histidine kinase [Methanomicrobiales archaeon]|nr:PAS domain-containing sensor histidine kinase [Methanomicrobiales archaeon]
MTEGRPSKFPKADLQVLERAFTALPVAVLIISPKRQEVVYWNAAFQDLLKTTPTSQGFAFLTATVHPDDNDALLDFLNDTSNISRERHTTSIRVVHPPGETRWVEVKGSRLHLATSDSDLTLLTMYDITPDRGDCELALLATGVLNRLASHARHDTLNKLTVVSGYLEFVKEDITDATTLQMLGKVEDAAQGIRRIMEVTRSYQNYGTVRPKWLNLEEMMAGIRLQTDLSGIPLDYSVHGLELSGDPIIAKVIANLIDNVVRHGRSATKIRISTHEGEGSLTISCEDDGIGIPDTDKEKVFGRTYAKSNGFSLFISREILTTMDMNIRETGIPGQGARFDLLVPRGKFRWVRDAPQK